MTDLHPDGDAGLARALAARAGEHLLALRASDLPPTDLRAQGDRSAHDLLVDGLAQARPGDVVLSEEGKDDPARYDADRVWIVDPLDGTREYGETERTDWAVHVALWQRAAGEAGDLVAGAVALPALGEVLGTDQPPATPAAAADRLRIAVSRTRPPALVQRLAELLEQAGTPVELVPLGSAGRKVCAVVRGEVEAYVHGGGQYEWDSAAPVAVARAAGLHTSRLDGAPLRYNAPDPWLPDLLVAHPRVAPALLAALRTCGEETPA